MRGDGEGVCLWVFRMMGWVLGRGWKNCCNTLVYQHLVRGFGEDGGIGSTRNLSPHLDSSYAGRSGRCECFEALESTEGLQLLGEGLDSKLQQSECNL